MVLDGAVTAALMASAGTEATKSSAAALLIAAIVVLTGIFLAIASANHNHLYKCADAANLKRMRAIFQPRNAVRGSDRAVPLEQCLLNGQQHAAGQAFQSAPPLGLNEPLGSPRYTDEGDGLIIIVGSGIAGLSCAAALFKVGIPALVLEKESGPREEGAAITFWPNAFRVLDELGVAGPLRKTHPLLERVAIATHKGHDLTAFGLDECPGGPHEARIVRRAALLDALRSALPPHAIRYGACVAAVRTTAKGAEVELVGGEVLGCRAVVGADGTKSRMASLLGLKPASYAGEVYFRGLAEFPEGVPEAPGTLRQIWSDRGSRVGISSISCTQCFWFITLSCPEEMRWQSAEERKADALAAAEGFAFHIQDAIRNTPAEGISRNRIMDRWLVSGSEVGKSCLTVAGDALHPMTANLGQGGCVALEDGVKLAQALAAAGGLAAPPPVVAAALRGYERERTTRAAPVTTKSWLMGAALQIQNPWVCVLRNWAVRNLFPVKSFLRPAAYHCGSLEACCGSAATSDYTSSSEEGSPLRRPAAVEDWTPDTPK